MNVIRTTRKPIVVEAFHFTDESQNQALKDWAQVNGNLLISIGDWVLKSVNGGITICPPESFDLIYDYEKESK